MITFEALFKISHGLYIVSSGDNTRVNGFILNTVFQVTSEPARFVTCCNKKNFTAEFITRSGAFSESVWICPFYLSEKEDFMEIIT